MMTYSGFSSAASPSNSEYYVFAVSVDGSDAIEIAHFNIRHVWGHVTIDNNTICWITHGKQRYNILSLQQVEYFIL